MKTNIYFKYLTIFLYAVAIHSFLVGIALIFIPASALTFFGFNDYKESFFQAQGGIFHIAMSIAYFMAARRINNSEALIHFIILVKLLAAVFLFSYAILAFTNWLILLSALSDGIMCAVIAYLFTHIRNEIK